MSFNEGDFVQIDYTARRASDNTLVFTTIEKVAKENNFPEGKYVPQLVIVGKNNTIKGVENAVKGMSVNESKKVTIEPKDAFGERNESFVSVMHQSEFKKKDIDPQPGMQINIDGNIAMIKSVNSGRVVVDLNHPLAGEKLLYEIKVIKKLDTDKEKVEALAEYFSAVPDSVSIENKAAKAVFGEKVKKDADYFLNKSAFAEAVLRYIPAVSKVVIDEEYGREPAEKKDA